METNNAHEAYRAAREKLESRLDALNRLIRAHDAREFRDRENWGYAGDLGHVVEVLDEVIEFLGGAKETSK